MVRSRTRVDFGRWLVFLPVATLAWFAPSASAEPIVGLNAVGYAYSEAEGIPTKSDTAYSVCHSETEDNINRNFEGEPFGNCPDDFFLIHYTGFIQIPEHQTIEFWVAADDGGTVKIGVHEFGDWNLKGCTATETGLLDISAGTQPLDGWFYEWGGGTCYMLAWNIDGAGWEIVPPEAFTNEPLSTTTTTTTTILLEPSSTTTTTSSTVLPASTSTTLQEPSTTSTATPQYTTTPFIEPAISPSSTSPQIEETPDTGLPITTDPPTTSTPATSPTTTTYVQDTSNIDITVDTEVPAPAPPDTILEAPTGNEGAVLEAVLAFNAVMDVLDDPEATNEQIVEAIETLLEKEVTTDQAVEVITDSEVLAAVPVEVAQAIFEAIIPSELSADQIDQITEAVQGASEEVREAFEETIDIFGEGFDTYQPRGSTISVAQRRAVVAVTAVLLAVPAPVPQRRRF